MPFVTAGDPDLQTTQAAIRALAAEGVDLIEVGVPYSDPIADGPVIQASYTRALAKGFQIGDLFAAIGELTTSAGKSTANSALPPLVAMVAYAIVFRVGPRTFVERARDAGFAGLIVPDLPADEAGELSQIAGEFGIDLVELIAPTTTPERARRIVETSRGFIYCVSIAGTTGVRDQLPAELKQQLQWLRSQTDLPLAVGFGISRPEQVEELRGLADGVIVGSALVRQLAAISEAGTERAAAVAGVAELARRMVEESHRASRRHSPHHQLD